MCHYSINDTRMMAFKVGCYTDELQEIRAGSSGHKTKIMWSTSWILPRVECRLVAYWRVGAWEKYTKSIRYGWLLLNRELGTSKSHLPRIDCTNSRGNSQGCSSGDHKFEWCGAHLDNGPRANPRDWVRELVCTGVRVDDFNMSGASIANSGSFHFHHRVREL